jgi:CubicO group peptidase (beta-lactamase class C family)
MRLAVLLVSLAATTASTTPVPTMQGAGCVVTAERVGFEIGSISKVFTGLLLTQAVTDGKLAFTDTLAQRITLRQLATHTSCLPRLPDNMNAVDAGDPYAQYDGAALFAYLGPVIVSRTPPEGDAVYYTVTPG